MHTQLFEEDGSERGERSGVLRPEAAEDVESLISGTAKIRLIALGRLQHRLRSGRSLFNDFINLDNEIYFRTLISSYESLLV